ncbi:hypothetical protein FA743_15105 [Paracoccus gahaiensis]|uniref:DUF2946 domain-containing protein n=1 Tax=Paracoccus gahaiensis TaxID=1706839 RepID=A0A4U0R651_9RHOB|nr:hypothetical protein [Paracoccus gahaiensis]TJZ90471.1 hypothetical protein FA743_15105 [Paracoccus gahaiensis]
MIRPLPLILILVVMLTSIGLGAARGTVLSGEQIVLCTGHGIVTIELPGDQGSRTHLCPDMALSILAAIGPADVALPLRVAHGQEALPDRGAGQGSERQGPVRVRDPPGAGLA